MNTSSVHQDFMGYGAYPVSESEALVRRRLLGCLGVLNDKIEICFDKACGEGREKLMSQILTAKKLMQRIIKETEKSLMGARYRFDPIPAGDAIAAVDIDTRLEELIAGCGGTMDSLTCSETEMHIIDRFTHIISSLNEIDSLFHERARIFKRMQIYG